MVIHGCLQNIQIIVLAQIYFLQEDLKMNIGVTEISPREVQRKAEKCFKDGYYCCEALVSTIRDEFKLDVPKEVVAMASGMAVKARKSGYYDEWWVSRTCFFVNRWVQLRLFDAFDLQ